MKSIYELELHETIKIDGFTTVMRVPDGWIYESRFGQGICGTFVKYSDEFNPKIYKEQTHEMTSLEDLESAIRSYEHQKVLSKMRPSPSEMWAATMDENRGFVKCPSCGLYMDKVCMCEVKART